MAQKQKQDEYRRSLEQQVREKEEKKKQLDEKNRLQDLKEE